jgi:hypothetical protein
MALAQSASAPAFQTDGPVAPYSVWPWVEPISEIADPISRAAWPKISIVTPNFNYGYLIEATLRSVLMQNYPNLEYIVIDGDSTDDSIKVIRKYESKLGYFEHRQDEGQYHAINKGFSKATGEIFGWLNSDDIYLPWTLTVVGKIFSDFPEVQWITGRPSAIQDGIVQHVHPYPVLPREMIRAGLFHSHPGGFGSIQQESCFWRRGLWEKAGGLREALRYAADFHLWVKFAEFAELYSVSTLLGGFSSRGNDNRSMASADKYAAEIRQVEAELRGDPMSPEAILAKKFTSFTKLKRVFGARVARRLLRLPHLEGAVLHWDCDRRRYWPKRERYTF